MSSKSIVFNPSSMRRSQLKMFVVYGVLLLLALIAAVFCPRFVRILILFFCCFVGFFLILGVARFFTAEVIKEVSVTDFEITVNGNSYPLSEDGDVRLVFDSPFASERFTLLGHIIRIRGEKFKTLKRYWVGPTNNKEANSALAEFIGEVMRRREEVALENIRKELQDSSASSVKVEFPQDSMRTYSVTSALVIIVMGILLWAIGRFTFADDSFIYEVSENFGALIVMYGICFGLFSLYNMTRAIRSVEVTSEGIKINKDSYGFATIPEIEVKSTVTLNGNEYAADVNTYFIVSSLGSKRKYWAGPKNDKKSIEARRRLIMAIERFDGKNNVKWKSDVKEN